MDDPDCQVQPRTIGSVSLKTPLYVPTSPLTALFSCGFCQDKKMFAPGGAKLQSWNDYAVLSA